MPCPALPHYRPIYLKRKKNNASNTKLLFCVTITCNIGPLTWVITKESLVPIESDEKTYSSIYRPVQVGIKFDTKGNLQLYCTTL